MARLTTLKPTIGRLRSSVAWMPEDRQQRDRFRDQTQARQWYRTPEWRALRADVLERDGFTCQWPTCGRFIAVAKERVVDHVRPHRGDRALFFDRLNLQTLCKACHDGPKQRAERRTGQ